MISVPDRRYSQSASRLFSHDSVFPNAAEHSIFIPQNPHRSAYSILVSLHVQPGDDGAPLMEEMSRVIKHDLIRGGSSGVYSASSSSLPITGAILLPPPY